MASDTAMRSKPRDLRVYIREAPSFQKLELMHMPLQVKMFFLAEDLWYNSIYFTSKLTSTVPFCSCRIWVVQLVEEAMD